MKNGSVPRSCSLRYAQTVPKRPNGTETRNTSRQLIGASRPPSTSPMNTPLMPAMLLMPSARPRWLVGKASVRIAAELPIRQAAPMPWTTRNAIRLGAFHARLDSTEPARKMVSATSQSRLPPNRACAHTTSGMVTPSASR